MYLCRLPAAVSCFIIKTLKAVSSSRYGFYILTKCFSGVKIIPLTVKRWWDMSDDFSMLRSALQKVDFFYSLNIMDLDDLIKSLKKRKANKGDVLIKQGEIGDKFYLIGSGAVSVAINKKRVAELGEGDFFGEMALITDLPRTATVTALEPSEFFVLYKKDFKKILLSKPKIAHIINEVLAKRRPGK
jgi:signal-transduction protein with cAMP-binding, CBS, and nucleotidyltransferase domain